MAEKTIEDPVAGLLCAAPPRPRQVLPPNLSPARERAILVGRSKWVNGTQLRYTFLPGANETQADVVRDSFAEWKKLGIGLNFSEVRAPAEAEVRIAFADDGSWSYLGRDVLGIPVAEPTMNFGWDLTTPHGRDTARHEIGHTLGFAHEHQNPNAGIVWDEEKVYEFLGGPPNNWPRETTFHNVLRKLAQNEVQGSNWDPLSVMEYAFPPGLVLRPEEFGRDGINPPGGLSALDVENVLAWYPGTDEQPLELLRPFASVPMRLAPAGQRDFRIEPEASRTYTIGTFGESDAVLVLFEDVDGELRFVAGDDDGGEDRNARLQQKLFAGRKYVARIRLYYAGESGETAVMYW